MGGRHIKWVVIAAWLVAALIAFPFQSKLAALASDESDAFQDRGAESTRVDRIIDTRFKGGADTTTVVLYTRDDGPLNEADQQRIAADAMALCKRETIPDVVRVITSVQLGCGDLPPITPPQSSLIKATSEDQTTQLTTIWTSDDATETVAEDVAAIRAIVPEPGRRRACGRT